MTEAIDAPDATDAGRTPRLAVCQGTDADHRAWASYLIAAFDSADPWGGAAPAVGRAEMYQAFDEKGRTARIGERESPEGDAIVGVDDDALGFWGREIRQALYLAAGQGDEPSGDFYGAHVAFDDVRKLGERSWQVALTVTRGGGGTHAWNSTTATMTLRGLVETRDDLVTSARLIGEMRVDLPTDFAGKRREHVRRPLRFEIETQCSAARHPADRPANGRARR